MDHYTTKQLKSMLRDLTQRGRRDEEEMEFADPETFALVRRIREELRKRNATQRRDP